MSSNWNAFNIRRAKKRRLNVEYLEERRLLTVSPAWFQEIAVPSPILSLAADADGSGDIGLGDFGLLKQNFGEQQATKETGDFNGDGMVTLADFGILKQTFGMKDDVMPFQWNDSEVEKVENLWAVKLKAGTANLLAQPSDAQTYFDPYGMTVLKGLGQVGWLLVETTNDDINQLSQDFAATGVVETFEPEVVISADFVPNDPKYSSQWNMPNINAPSAWDTTVGSQQTIVAVLDTGIDYMHEDLANNMWENPFEIAGNGMDDDGNGFTDDRYGYDFQNGDGDPNDDHGHGTHVAGIIGAVGNNATGVIGTSPNVTLLPIKVLGSDGKGLLTTVAAGINYATQLRNDGKPIRVMNASLGSDNLDFTFGSYTGAIAEAERSDIMFVAAAGNDGRNTDFAPRYPASLTNSNIISVANTTSTDNLSSSSNFGVVSVDIGAPGELIESTLPGDAYGLMSGTSMAAPHVSGAAALMFSVAPDAWVDEVRDKILTSARPVAALSGVVASGGILNLAGALGDWAGGNALRPHFYMPPWVAGEDRDFAGNGPEIETMTVDLRISPDGTTLETRVSLDVVETGSSGTTQASGTSGWETAWVAPHGQKIAAINSPTTSVAPHFVDTDHEADIIEMPLGDLVHHYEFIGDTDGDDAGVMTGVRVYFRSPEIVLQTATDPGTDYCTISLDPIHFEPAHVRGDTDFDGNGPLIDTFVQIRENGGDIEGRVYLHAQEWENALPRADHTTFDEWSPWFTLYSGGVDRILTPMQSSIVYVDTDHTDDLLNGDRLVSEYYFIGDRDGGPFGGPDQPEVTVTFNDILVQRAGCGSAAIIPRSHFYIPPAVGGGDLEFDGNGPDINLFTELRISPDGKTLETRVHMEAQETNAGDTRADGISNWETAYVAPLGNIITAITSPTNLTSTHNMTDTTHSADIVQMPPDDLVDRYEIVGDTDGDDSGIKTGVRVYYHPVSLTFGTPPTISNTTVISPHSIFFQAPNVRPDAEFDGNGPLMDAFVQLRVFDGEVQARIHLHGQEMDAFLVPKPDFTTFDGWSPWQSISFGQIPPGQSVNRVIGPMQAMKSYFDTDHLDDVILGSDPLVAEWRFVGDRDQLLGGTDVPSVEVLFRDIIVELTGP